MCHLKFPFTNKWLFSLVAGNASGLLWKLPWPGEEVSLPKAIHPFWGSLHPMSAQCKSPWIFLYRMGILRRASMSLLCSQLKPGFSVYPILYILSFLLTDLDLECALMNFMHANFQLRTLPKETEAQYLPNRRGLNLKMSTPTPRDRPRKKK